MKSKMTADQVLKRFSRQIRKEDASKDRLVSGSAARGLSQGALQVEPPMAVGQCRVVRAVTACADAGTSLYKQS
jgi:hypothetical protein